jgi:hypothetical protein
MGMAFTIKINYDFMKNALILQPRKHKKKQSMVSNTHQTNKEEMGTKPRLLPPHS